MAITAQPLDGLPDGASLSNPGAAIPILDFWRSCTQFGYEIASFLKFRIVFAAASRLVLIAAVNVQTTEIAE